MLHVKELESGYGPMQVLWKPSLNVKEGSITSLLGPNGVGKSTFLMTVFGSVQPWAGQIIYDGEDVTQLPTHIKVDKGLTLVPEGKHLFAGMTVYENLIMGAYLKRAQQHKEESLQLVYTLFPRLKERSRQMAGSLSGGEQQMVTIARALMTKPKMIMLDEPSQGLAPLLVKQVFDTIEKMRAQMGLTILLVEQNADASLGAADYVYVMHEGKIKAEGTPQEIKSSDEIREAYLGL
ncbi:MAG: ABC transporter ATP-binding protein [Deltaproteobacteria bacterium]|nr:ABC transporter ATP-binding protein [Deltaproteobacteria bacterium]MBW1929668.1 ABC transporter ATP-binding protein [Deltaproteobacteria bacterium]MBW2025255.1 ABC transporter ATP-binding protein [Deltaproteobacteria bacterium]MBW2125159.1 ABC transporter ATP-binding protein [Deltaproteobacteria bacterium]RLB15639.1 MAG: branched-chain amino acid ABC transporter ATP-binding protein [Deltaproteobacteria bacterium]